MRVSAIKGGTRGAKGWLDNRGGEAYIYGADAEWRKGTTEQS